MCVCVCVLHIQSIWTTGAHSNVTSGPRSVLAHMTHTKHTNTRSQTHGWHRQMCVCAPLSLPLCLAFTNTFCPCRNSLENKARKEKSRKQRGFSLSSLFFLHARCCVHKYSNNSQNYLWITETFCLFFCFLAKHSCSLYRCDDSSFYATVGQDLY